MTTSETNPRPKILIVDDAVENLNVLIEILGHNYTIASARSGARALQLAADSNPPDLILLDIMMPSIDGYEVCRQLKANPKTRDIPIIFLTLLSDKGSELHGFDVGAVDYIHKPFSVALVQARVAIHLELAAARRQLASQVKALEIAARLREDVDRIIRHDLKGPLIPILTYVQLLLETNCTPKQRDFLQEIYASGNTMLEIINISLDVYKMEAGTYMLEPSALRLDVTLKSLLTRLDALKQRRGIEIAANLPPTTVLGEEILCLVLFNNLIKNAIEATSAGQSIHIELGSAADQAVVSIHNPTPVPAAVRAAFFDKYTTAGKPSGTGLGTYSARLMAKTMGGDISMQTGEESGTRIIVRLPQH